MCSLPNSLELRLDVAADRRSHVRILCPDKLAACAGFAGAHRGCVLFFVFTAQMLISRCGLYYWQADAHTRHLIHTMEANQLSSASVHPNTTEFHCTTGAVHVIVPASIGIAVDQGVRQRSGGVEVRSATE